MKHPRISRKPPRRRVSPLLLVLFLSPMLTKAQTVIVDSSQPGYRTVIAGPEYKAGGIYQFFWGKHYRKEWTTPVKVPVVNLDEVAGGLKPVQLGGGRQSKTLRLQNKDGKQYVLRSVDKDYGKALPEIARGTFIEDVAKDAVSTGHPFGAITVPPMIEAAGVYHTNPRIVFVPYTPSLGEFNSVFANTLCLLEERPDENQEDAANFGNSKDVKGTEKILENLTEKNDRFIDQRAFVRARLFDMFLGDWGRHDDQWRWAEFDSGKAKLYRPIPRDRDQAFAKFDGFLINRILSTEPLEHLQTFDYHIKKVSTYNFPARYIDRRFTNQITRDTWIDIARELQQSLNDAVIESGVRQMPPELFSISGNEFIAKLKSRRNDLMEYAGDYYDFLAKEVEVVGTEKKEYFLVNRINEQDTRVQIFDINSEDQVRDVPFYDRTFHANETREIRIFGLDGKDRYRIEGDGSSETKIRLIGGPDEDSVVNATGSKSKLVYYDNPGNYIEGPFRKTLSKDSAVNAYDYKGFKYDHNGLIILPNYSNTRGVFFQLGYFREHQQWRKFPFGWKQSISVNYSITNKGFGRNYDGVFNELIGKWNLLLSARYDQKLKNYYFGLGNETPFTEDINYYRYLNSEGFASVGLNRLFGHHSFTLGGFYQTVKVDYDGKSTFINLPQAFVSANPNRFIGANANYSYFNLNDDVVPTKGFGFIADATRSWSQEVKGQNLNRYSASMGFYLPFSKTISLAVRTGGATLTGDPEFYQRFWLGGGQNLRGYHRQRFYGNSMFYDNNEIRWIPSVRSYLFNGKIGLIGFFDNGRVWQGSGSDKWHFGYGGGLLLAPFNKLSVTVYYGVSEEDQKIHIRLGRFF